MVIDELNVQPAAWNRAAPGGHQPRIIRSHMMSSNHLSPTMSEPTQKLLRNAALAHLIRYEH
jgi:hypothetical protein